MDDVNLYDEVLDTPDFIEDFIEEVVEDDISAETYSLLNRGYLTKSFKVGQHDIVIRTMKIGEELSAALLAQKYSDTADGGRALITAMVAGCIITVDGRPLVRTLGPKEPEIESKYEFIFNNWYWATIRDVYIEYQSLVEQAEKELDAVKKD